MRVLYVTNMWPDHERPWYGSFVHSQARSLQAKGIELDVLVIRGYVSDFEYARGIARALVRSVRCGHDVIHAHFALSAVVARFDIRAPLVISYCGDDLLGTPDRHRPARKTRRSRALASAFAQLSYLARATITKSEEMAGHLPKRRRSRNHVIPNGVDLAFFSPGNQLQARHELGWPEHEKVALFVGNPKEVRKNHQLAVAASEIARRRCPNVRLRTAWGVTPALLPTWMRAADVLLFPSWSEGSPNVVKEAMASELPIVATPVGDVHARLQGIPGCHVVAPDEQSFADALVQAVHHGRCPQARAAVAELSLDRVADRVSALYESVAG